MSNRWRRSQRRIAISATALGLAVGLAGCGSGGRSVSAYCTYFYKQGTAMRNQQMAASADLNQDPLNALVSVLGAPDQLADFFNGAAQRAPESIAPDVSEIGQAFQKLADSEGTDVVDPLSGMLDSLMAGFSATPAYDAVNSWTDAKCGPPPGTKWLHS